MSNWRTRTGAMAVLLATVVQVVCAAPAKPTSDADVALAERFAEIGRGAALTKNPVEPTWRQSAALLDIACRLDPTEARFPRLLAEAMIQAKDTAGAIAAYKRVLALNKEDRGAQVALVDLYLQDRSRLQSVDQQLNYLKGLVGSAGKVPDEVRSFAATKAANLLLERSQKDQALGMIGQALRLNPLNYEACWLHFKQLPDDATSLERVQAMLAILRINPALPAYSWLLAKQLSAVGLVEQSLIWYAIAGNAMPKLGQTVPIELVSEYASELYLSDQAAPTALVTSNLLEAEPGNIDAWFVRLLLDKDAGKVDATNDQRAMVALVNRLQMARKSANVANATTRPVLSPGPAVIPDLTGDVAVVKSEAKSELQKSYAAAIGDILWCQMYFKKQAPDPKLVEFLKAILPSDHLLLLRIDGWSAFLQDKFDEAKAKFTAAGDRDPLCRLGLILIQRKDPKQLDAADSEARKLLAQNPYGVNGAMLWGALKSPAVKLVPAPQSDAILEELRKLPRDWVTILDSPQNFYSLRIDPVQIAHDFSEPMVVRVTIQNMTDYDLPIGTDAVLHPDLIFDAEQVGAGGQQFSGVAYDRISEQLVLRAHKAVSQVVRVDQGKLSEHLMQAPSMGVPLRVYVTTNPMIGNGAITPGPGGYRAQAPRVMERRGTLMNTAAAQQRVIHRVNDGQGAEKIRAMEALSVYALVIRLDKNATEDMKDLGRELEGVIFHASDTSPSMQAWIEFLRAAMGTLQETEDAVKIMSKSDYWMTQMLAMLAARAFPAEQEMLYVNKVVAIAKDPDVIQYANARIQLTQLAKSNPAATQPIRLPTVEPKVNLGPAAPVAPGSVPVAEPVRVVQPAK